MAKAISSEAPKGERSETIPKGSRREAPSKRQAPSWGEDIVQSLGKLKAVQEVFNSGFKVDAAGCWKWHRGMSHGYGQMRVREAWGTLPVYAHRVSWLIHKGPVTGGLSVLHDCDNHYCVNPEHLFLGTQQDNLADMVKKNRHAKGESNGQTKVTDACVSDIRALVAMGVKQFEVAKRIGLSQAQVSRIVRGSRRATAKGETRKQHGNFKHGAYAASKHE